MPTHASPTIARPLRDRELAITRNLELVAKAMSGLASQLVPLHLPSLGDRSQRPLPLRSGHHPQPHLRSA